MNPPPTLTELQLSPKLAREVVELAGYATFRAGLRRAALTGRALGAEVQL